MSHPGLLAQTILYAAAPADHCICASRFPAPTDDRSTPSAANNEPPRSPALDSHPSADPFLIDSHPSEQSLIEAYLRSWVASSGDKKAAFIHEADPYTAGPDDLIGAFPPAVAQDSKQVWYFFTRLRHRSDRDRDRRVKRTVAGGGSWHGETRAAAVFHGLQQIGWRQSFSFKNQERVRTGWMMWEHRLYNDEEAGGGEVPVLCKVYRRSDSRKPKAPAVVRPPETESEGETNGDASSAAMWTAQADQKLSWVATEKKAADSAKTPPARKRKHVAAAESSSSGAARKRKPGLNSDDQLSDPSDSMELSQDSVHQLNKAGDPGGKVENTKTGQMQLKLAQEELRVRRLEALAKKAEQENTIMLMDTSKLDETQRAYVEAMRAQILASKRGGSAGWE